MATLDEDLKKLSDQLGLGQLLPTLKQSIDKNAIPGRAALSATGKVIENASLGNSAARILSKQLTPTKKLSRAGTLPPPTANQSPRLPFSFIPVNADGSVNPDGPVNDIRNASREAGGGIVGAGAGTREALNQFVIQPVKAINNQFTDAGDKVSDAAREFARGFRGAPEIPEPGQPTPVRRAADGNAANPGSLLSLVTGTPNTPVPTGVNPPLLPGLDGRKTQANSGSESFGINNVPPGGGFISFNEALRPETLQRVAPQLRDQLQQDGTIRITPNRARDLSGRANTVSSDFFTGGGVGAGAQSQQGQSGGARRSKIIGDRSQSFDEILKDLVSQATTTPDSFDELFRRKGVLSALGQIAGVAQSAGTNATTDITNVRDILQRNRGDDLAAQSAAARDEITAEGDKLRFNEGVLGTLVGRRSAEERNQVLENNAIRNAQATVEAQQLKIDADAKAQLERIIISGVNGDGTPLTEEDRKEAERRLQVINAKLDPLQFLQQQ